MARFENSTAFAVLVIACALLFGLAMYVVYYFSIGRLITSMFVDGDRSLPHLILHLAGFVLAFLAVGYLGTVLWRRYEVRRSSG